MSAERPLSGGLRHKDKILTIVHSIAADSMSTTEGNRRAKITKNNRKQTEDTINSNKTDKTQKTRLLHGRQTDLLLSEKVAEQQKPQGGQQQRSERGWSKKNKKYPKKAPHGWGHKNNIAQ